MLNFLALITDKKITAHICAEITHRGSKLAIDIPVVYNLTKWGDNCLDPVYYHLTLSFSQIVTAILDFHLN